MSISSDFLFTNPARISISISAFCFDSLENRENDSVKGVGGNVRQMSEGIGLEKMSADVHEGY